MQKLKFAVLSGLCGVVLLTTNVMHSIAAEEQIIIDDLSPAELRAQIKRIETEFYRVFNTSTDDETLAVICYEFAPSNSNMKQDVCEPQFVIDKRAENVNDSNFGIDTLLSPQSLRRELDSEYAALTEALTNLAKQNDYFRELNSILGVLRKELEDR